MAKTGLVAPLEDVGADGENIEIKVEEEEEEGIPAKQLPDPGRPSASEIECHRNDHWPFRSWCEFCVKGRGIGLQHSRKEGSSIARIGIDYFFITAGGTSGAEVMEKIPTDEEVELGRQQGTIIKCIMIRCMDTKAMFAHVVPRKGPDEDGYVAGLIVDAIEWMGHAHCILKFDSEIH